MNDSTLVSFFDGKGDAHTLLCQSEVTLIAVQTYIRDGYTAPFRVTSMLPGTTLGTTGDVPMIAEVGGVL